MYTSGDSFMTVARASSTVFPTHSGQLEMRRVRSTGRHFHIVRSRTNTVHHFAVGRIQINGKEF